MTYRLLDVTNPQADKICYTEGGNGYFIYPRCGEKVNVSCCKGLNGTIIYDFP